MKRMILAGIAVIGGYTVLRTSRRLPGTAARYILYGVSTLYCVGFLYFTLLSRRPFESNAVNIVPFYSVMRSLRYPFRVREMPARIFSGKWQNVFTTLTPLRTAALNILLFIPLGYLLPEWIKGKKPRFRMILVISLGLSYTVEIVQLLTALGWCDVDDLICNVIGGLLGYMMYRIGQRKTERKIDENG